ncbi:hypothetical protein PPERSA_07096 [Pseudocohnilembus persalinus]|uniref:Kazal-like domain-containing protein n=1 Tax=Pseudocohnilembus persalinus TaxID=266149 RepID=A0A0V0QYH1_PSEPJ|nr:hypothetical protein PPERSA_07096 [Pseudocohnilembus persalinus]|eukprot:KRX06933.1 hypothetical protein PPERSA_07096 [Pseudocohnilembus persalinus]
MFEIQALLLLTIIIASTQALKFCQFPRPEECYEIYQPVCGHKFFFFDCQTYSNDCYACAEKGVYTYTEGACEKDLDDIEELDEEDEQPQQQEQKEEEKGKKNSSNKKRNLQDLEIDIEDISLNDVIADGVNVDSDDPTDEYEFTVDEPMDYQDNEYSYYSDDEEEKSDYNNDDENVNLYSDSENSTNEISDNELYDNEESISSDSESESESESEITDIEGYERSEVCTLHYLPVCGKLSNGASKTYSNDCVACSDEKVISYSEGSCEEIWNTQSSRKRDHFIGEDENTDEVKHECTIRSQLCTKIYQPVCGYFNSDIQCFKYPCAQNYGNSCTACADDKVDYYILGKCPI